MYPRRAYAWPTSTVIQATAEPSLICCRSHARVSEAPEINPHDKTTGGANLVHSKFPPMSRLAAADIPLLVRSENSSSERRVSPSWTISQLKSRLEPITGVPASCQKLTLGASASERTLEVGDEDASTVEAWRLRPYSEIYVSRFSLICEQHVDHSKSRSIRNSARLPNPSILSDAFP